MHITSTTKYVNSTGLVLCQGQVEYSARQDVPPSCSQNTPGSTTCFTLYTRADGGGATWTEAFDYCRSTGRQLAVVSDNATQSILGQFKSSVFTGNGHTWIAGKRDPDPGVWKTINGELVPEGKHISNISL